MKELLHNNVSRKQLPKKSNCINQCQFKSKQYLNCIEKLQLVEALKKFLRKHKHQITRFNGSFLGQLKMSFVYNL